MSVSEKRVLMMVNTHVYDDPRVMSEAAALAKVGYQIVIIGAARLGGVPTRKEIDGITVMLVPMVTKGILHGTWQLLRGKLDPLTQTPPSAQTTIISFTFFILWCLRLGLPMRAGVYHAHDLSPLPAAWLLSRMRGGRLVYDSHESAADFYRGRKGQIMARLEKLLIAKPNCVITVGERLAAKLRDRGARRVIVVGNWKRPEAYNVSPEQIERKRQEYQLTGNELVITFIGDLTRAFYELAPLLRAVQESPETVLFIAGRGDMQGEIEAAAARSPNIRWLGWLPIAEVPVYSRLADAIYCCFSPHYSQVYYVAPNKLFEGFMAERAIIARRGVGEIGEILERIPAAILLDEVTPETIKAAFAKLRDPVCRQQLQQAASEGRAEYNWNVAESRLLQLYAELLPISHR